MLIILGIIGFWTTNKFNFFSNYQFGQKIDSMDRVAVYYNGGSRNIFGRNRTSDGYNLGLKYQCVEFVKRYYYEHYDHRMPDSYGNAKDYFDPSLDDGQLNIKRGLTQFRNPSKSQPKKGDLLIFEATYYNQFGHVAIVSKVEENKIEIIQQNPGKYASSREEIRIKKKNRKWTIKNSRILGWLRKE